jgi:hypothetical protein
MNEGDITITLTESQHELLLEVLLHAREAQSLFVPSDGLRNLPLDNPIVQRCTMVQNLEELLLQLWSDRFE